MGVCQKAPTLCLSSLRRHLLQQVKSEGHKLSVGDIAILVLSYCRSRIKSKKLLGFSVRVEA